MGQSLADFIIVRYKELAAAEETLRLQLDSLTEEKQQIEKAAEAAGIDLDEIEVVQSPIFRGRRSIPEKTIKEAVLEVLEGKGEGMTALQILAEINQRFSTSYPRTSLSPQLSRLKAEHKIYRVGVVLAEGRRAAGADCSTSY